MNEIYIENLILMIFDPSFTSFLQFYFKMKAEIKSAVLHCTPQVWLYYAFLYAMQREEESSYNGRKCKFFMTVISY